MTEAAVTEPVEDVAEAVVEQEIETPQDEVVSRGVESIAKDLFGVEPEDVPRETDEVEVEVEEEPEEEPEEKAEEVEEEKEPRPAPQSWKKEMHEVWESLDDGAKDYIELREDQMKKGLEKDRNDAELGRTMRDVFAPYEKMLESKGISHDVAVSRLMATHYKLATANPEEKKQILDYLAKSYGITQEGNENADPNIVQLQNQIHNLQNQLNAGQQRSLQEAKGKIHSEVEAFASEHPYFDDLSEEIAMQIRAGHELDDAYKIAYRASHFYDKDMEKKQKESEKTAKEAKKKEAEKAAKAKSANVRGRDTEKAPTAPKGTMEDTMRDVYRKIQSRN